MSDRDARRAVAGVACVLFATVTLLAMAGPRDGHPRRPASPAATDRAITRGASLLEELSDRDRRRRAPAASTRDRRAARRAASNFVTALLRYQAGQRRSAWRPVFVATATSALRDELTHRPPRPPRSHKSPRGRLRSIELHRLGARAVKASALVGYRHGPPSLLELQLRRRAGRWVVTALYR